MFAGQASFGRITGDRIQRVEGTPFDAPRATGDSVPLAAILVAAFPASLLAAWAFHIAVEAPSMRLGSALTRIQVASAGGHPWRTMTAEEQGAES